MNFTPTDLEIHQISLRPSAITAQLDNDSYAIIALTSATAAHPCNVPRWLPTLLISLIIGMHVSHHGLCRGDGDKQLDSVDVREKSELIDWNPAMTDLQCVFMTKD